MHIVDGAAQERAKYEEIWQIPAYKNYSGGLENVERFMKVMNPPPSPIRETLTLIDIGCGEGLGGLAFQRLGFQVDWMDLTRAGLHVNVPLGRFIEAPLWSDWGSQRRTLGWRYGFCCDVMEHIPTEYTMLCIDRILSYCGQCWFQIDLNPDQFGKMIGEPLHLTVRPYDWWLVRMATLGKVLDARDLCGQGLYVVQS